MHSKPDAAAFGPQRSDLMFSVAKLISFPLLRVQSLDATATPHALPAYVICTSNNFQGESVSINCQEKFHTEPFLCILIGTLTSHPQSFHLELFNYLYIWTVRHHKGRKKNDPGMTFIVFG